MIFTIDRKIMQNLVAGVISIINKKSPLSVLTNILLEIKDNNLYIIGTNMEISIIKHIPIVADNSKCIVKAHVLYDIIKKTSGQNLNFSKNNNLIIQDEKGVFNVLTSEEEFPMQILENPDFSVNIKSKELIKIIKSSFININDEGHCKLIFNNNTITFLCNDKRRLSFSSIENNNNHNNTTINMSIKSINEILKICNEEEDVKIEKKNREFAISNLSTLLIAKEAYGTELDYQYFIKDIGTYHKFQCSNLELKDGVSRVVTMSSVITRSVKLVFNNNKLEIMSFDPTIGSSNTIINGEGSFEGIITLNGDYIIDSLNCAVEKTCALYYIDKHKQLIINNGGYHIIMPIRL